MGAQVILINPKWEKNLAAAIRACACFGAERITYTGNRIEPSFSSRNKLRLPREQRLYSPDVLIAHQDQVSLEALVEDESIPVAVEFRTDFQPLVHFTHPENAVYFFGPEDGSLPKSTYSRCHFHVHIPSIHPLNLSAAVYVVLYDRILKQAQGEVMDEMRSYIQKRDTIIRMQSQAIEGLVREEIQ